MQSERRAEKIGGYRQSFFREKTVCPVSGRTDPEEETVLKYRILAIGDIVGYESVECLKRQLWTLRRELGADFVVANGENAAEGNGLDAASAKTLLMAGVDVITTGNHVWKKNDLHAVLRSDDPVLRPANYPCSCPGTGYTVRTVNGYRVLVINVQGTTFMEALDNPFDTLERILEWERDRYDISVLDVHAEATGEKQAIARFFDGRISAVFGTHTHVQTADAQILPGGTGYLTDLGMTGPTDGILGMKKEIIIDRIRTKMPCRFAVAEGSIVLCGACFTVDTDTGLCVECTPVRKELGTA